MSTIIVAAPRAPNERAARTRPRPGSVARESYFLFTSTSTFSTISEPISLAEDLRFRLRHRPVVLDGVEARKGQRHVEVRVDERARDGSLVRAADVRDERASGDDGVRLCHHQRQRVAVVQSRPGSVDGLYGCQRRITARHTGGETREEKEFTHTLKTTGGAFAPPGCLPTLIRERFQAGTLLAGRLAFGRARHNRVRRVDADAALERARDLNSRLHAPPSSVYA